MLFYAESFDRDRAMQRLQDSLPDGAPAETSDRVTPRLEKKKVRVYGTAAAATAAAFAAAGGGAGSSGADDALMVVVVGVSLSLCMVCPCVINPYVCLKIDQHVVIV